MIQHNHLILYSSFPTAAHVQFRDLLGRPENEAVFAVVPCGYPSDECVVPYRTGMALRKALSQVLAVV